MCLVVFVFPNFCFAATHNYKELVISEIMYDPKEADANQTDWIELYNPTSNIINIKKDSFGIIDEKEIKLASDDVHYLNCHKIENDFDIPPKSYAILAENKENFVSLYPNIKNVFDSVFNLSSDGDFIKLSYDRCETFFIDFFYENSWGGKNNGNSLEKISADKKYDKGDWKESCIDGGTPGKDNSKKSDCIVLEEKNNSSFKIKKDDEIYKNIYAYFEVKYSDATDKTKYTWNFGDGHKSYLQKTRHKYEDSGTYQASITIRGDKKAFQNFTVKVADYSAPKVKIIRLVPNPKGKDSKEFIIIENKSKEKINLKGWSIATGWKNLVNYPIRDNFIINPGKSKKLTKKICAFTLNNSQNKIELRYPNGKTAQKLKYNRTKDKIEDDEVFKITGKNWTWNKPEKNTEKNKNNAIDALEKTEILMENVTSIEKSNLDATISAENVPINSSEVQENIGKYSENPVFIAKKKNRIQFIGYATKINTPTLLLDYPGKVAGVYAESATITEKSWIAKVINWTWVSINLNINLILNWI